MNRKQRRQEAKQFKKENKISMEDKRCILENLQELNYHAKFNHANFILQDCIEALLIELLEDYKLKDIEKLRDYIGDLMIEQHEKESKLIKHYGGVKDMKKALEKLEPKMFELIEELIAKGAKQKEIIEILVAKFPKLSRNQLIHAFKEFTEKISDKKETDTTQIKEVEGLDKIMDIIDNKDFKVLENKAKQTAKLAAETIIKEIEETPDEIETVDEIQAADLTKDREELKSKFKPILMKFTGDYGTYTKDSSSLKIDLNDQQLEFKSLEEITESEQEEIKMLNNLIEIAKKRHEEYKQAFVI